MPVKTRQVDQAERIQRKYRVVFQSQRAAKLKILIPSENYIHVLKNDNHICTVHIEGGITKSILSS